MQSLQNESMNCPYCGEWIEVIIDCSIEEQEYTEDCSVCCKPIIFSVLVSEGEIISLDGRTEDD